MPSIGSAAVPPLAAALPPGLTPSAAAHMAPFSQAALNFLIAGFPVPPFLLPIFQSAGIDYGVPWQVLAAINEIETDYGRNLSTSSAGAEGWMQFEPGTWATYGMDADGDGRANPYDPVDAIFAAARYLHAAGAGRNLPAAIFAYNHAGWYVNSVQLRAKLLELMPGGLIDGLAGLMQARFPVAGDLGPGANHAAAPLRLGGAPAAFIVAPRGAPVVAAADGHVIATGRSGMFGRFVTVQDSYGNRFTYSGLGSVAAVYPVLVPQVESVAGVARELGLAARAVLPAAASTAGTETAVSTARHAVGSTSGSALRSGARASARARSGAGAPPSTLSEVLPKERLFAHPSRPGSYAAGGQAQVSSPRQSPSALRAYAASSSVTGVGDARGFSRPLALAPGRFTLARLAPGAIVAGGTVIGRVGGGGRRATGITLQVQPAGSRVPVDPRPIVADWELLGGLTAGRHALTGPEQAGAFGAANPTIGQLLLSSRAQLAGAVLADPRVTLPGCVRSAVGRGGVDRRALAAIEYLSYSGLAPVLSTSICASRGAGLATGFELTSLAGVPVAGHEQLGGMTDLGIRRLLALQGAMRPQRIVSSLSYPTEPDAIALPGHADRVEVDYAPPAGAGAGTGAGANTLDTNLWQRVLTHLGSLTGSGASPPAPQPVVVRHPGPAKSTTGVLRSLSTRVHAAVDSVGGPTVTLQGPSGSLCDAPGCMRGQATFDAFAFAKSPRTIASVAFEVAPAGTGHWTTFDTESAPVSGSDYQATLDVTTLANGSYDVQAVATDNAPVPAQTTSNVVRGLTVADNASYVALAPPGSPLSGKQTLTATPEQGGATPDTVTFWTCPASAGCPANPDPTHPGPWKQLATVGPQLDNSGSPTGNYVTPFDTAALADGTYTIAVTAADGGGDPFQGGIVEAVLVDNTPPNVSMSSPSGTQTWTLSADAQDTGSGVQSVQFEAAPAGSSTWTTLATATKAPYTATVDTRQLADGSYTLRAVATDVAGNTAASPTVPGTVSNGGVSSFANLTVTNYVAPATNISLLGEIPGSPQHETWAFGDTNAPAPVIDGAKLPYTAAGNGQGVLLRYTDDTGWQIVDVLRNPDGTAYKLTAGQTPTVYGQITASGEGWLLLFDGSARSNPVFHRSGPGAPFVYDTGASLGDPAKPNSGLAAVSAARTLRLGQTGGTTYGVVVPTNPVGPSLAGSSPTGPVSVSARLDFGQLVNGQWTTVVPTTLPTGYAPPGSGVQLSLIAADATGPGTGWGLLEQTINSGSATTILARFDQTGWHVVGPTGLDALDGTGAYAPASAATASAGGSPVAVVPKAMRADGSGVWLSAAVGGGANINLVARYDTGSGRIVDSWCGNLPRPSSDCANPLDGDHPAAVPDATFDTASDGPVADALSPSTTDAIDVYAHGAWTAVATPGFNNFNGLRTGASVFADPSDGWLVGANTLGRVSASAVPAALASWPEANRNPLLSVALPPGQSTTDTAGALAVGLSGTALHYDPATGWQVDATPLRAHHVGLYGVAFSGPSSAFAVGQDGTILDWNGSQWFNDPQSVALTTNTLRAVAFGANGQGWAVGGNGTILHYDGAVWSTEQLDANDANASVTSVAVSGQNVYAIAAGNLVERAPDGTWARVGTAPGDVDPGLLPVPAPPIGSLKLVSGLPDGGLVVAGRSELMTRQTATDPLAAAPQSFEGIPVALAAFRDSGGAVESLVSIAPPIETQGGLSNDVGGFPAGDGDLIRQTASGYEDLSHDLPPRSVLAAGGDGVVQPDPVLGVAASPDGTHAWAVGGYSGTHAADGIGTDTVLTARSAGWLASAIWRYDAGGSQTSPRVAPAPVTLPATPGTVSFAFFSSAICKVDCAAVPNAQPDVNVRTATAQIAAFAGQPGGPAFAMLGGDARGPSDESSYLSGTGGLDLAHLRPLFAPLGSVPLYAAYGPLDGVPTSADPARPWADAFQTAPAPFGSGATPRGIRSAGSGDPTPPVNKYYAFDASQNGGTLRVIVLDNAAGSLESSAHGQTAWLDGQLAQAQRAGLPIVVIAARALDVNAPGAATDADTVANKLAAANVLGVFTTSAATSGTNSQPDEVVQVPSDLNTGGPQIPDYEGAGLGYQSSTGGVLWYDVSVDTVAHQLSVKGIPVVASVALEPLNGLTANRSSTLQFQAIARRPPSTIASTPSDPGFPGFNQYVSIPGSACTGCIGPSYSFRSSNPSVGDFVVASGTGSPYPKLTSTGHTIPSSTSGLFCAYNSGTTTITLTTGLLSASLPVTVNAGKFGLPCGTVPGSFSNIVTTPGTTIPIVTPAPQQGVSLPPSAAPQVFAPLPKLVLPALPIVAVPPAPKPHPAQRPPRTPPRVPLGAPQVTPYLPAVTAAAAALPATIPPPVAPPITPVPPGGATAPAQSTAKREERARRHARQSAFVTRPAGTSGTDWFYPAVGVVTVLTLLLVAGGMRPGPARRYAFVEVRDDSNGPQGRRR